MAGEGKSRRAHERYECLLEVDVSVYGGGENKPIESTRLKDISGGGAQFGSACIANYSIGNEIQLCIHIPNPHNEKKTVECSAYVVWVNDHGAPSDLSVSIAMNYVFDATQIKSLTSYSEDT